VRVPSALIQPIAGDDVAIAVCTVALAGPSDGTIEIAGPEPLPFDDFIREALRILGDDRVVLADPQVRYYGARLSLETLLPGEGDSSTKSEGDIDHGRIMRHAPGQPAPVLSAAMRSCP
jgi:uncharacterized protein YbjT (DUF2867 family)